MEGWVLKKRTETIPKIYQRRYMRLDDGSHEILYFKQPSEIKHKGAIDLLSAKRLWPTDSGDLGRDKNAKKFAEFALSLQTDKRTYFLLFENTDEYNSWLLAIWKACDQSQCTLHKALSSVPGIRAATAPKQLAQEPEFNKLGGPALRPPVRRIPDPERDGGESSVSSGRDAERSDSAGATRARAQSRRNLTDTSASGTLAPAAAAPGPPQPALIDFQVNLDDDDDDAILSGSAGETSMAGVAGDANPQRKMFSGLGSLFSRQAQSALDVADETDPPMRIEGGLGTSRGIGAGARGRPVSGRGRGRGRGGIELQDRTGPGGTARGRGRGAPGRGTPQRVARGATPRGRGGRPNGQAGLGARLLDSDEEEGDEDDESSGDGSDEDNDDDSDEEDGQSRAGKGGCCSVM